MMDRVQVPTTGVQLLEMNPAERLRTFREKDILTHSWFADVNIQEL